MKNHFIFSLMMLLVLNSCLIRTAKRPRQIFLHQVYPVTDSLYFKHAIICTKYTSDQIKNNNDTTIITNTDSILTIFNRALIKSYSKIKIDDQINIHCDENFKTDYIDVNRKTYDKILEYGESIIDEEDTAMYLVPYINIYVKDVILSSITPRRANRQDTRYYDIDFLISILKNKELIYTRFYHTYQVIDKEFEEDHSCTIPQERWDKIVYKLMRDFTKRLK